MTLPEALYRDTLTKWLQTMRDYPQDNTPEPEMPKGNCGVWKNDTGKWVCIGNIRAEVIRDFNRKETTL